MCVRYRTRGAGGGVETRVSRVLIPAEPVGKSSQAAHNSSFARLAGITVTYSLTRSFALAYTLFSQLYHGRRLLARSANCAPDETTSPTEKNEALVPPTRINASLHHQHHHQHHHSSCVQSARAKSRKLALAYFFRFSFEVVQCVLLQARPRGCYLGLAILFFFLRVHLSLSLYYH